MRKFLKKFLIKNSKKTERIFIKLKRLRNDHEHLFWILKNLNGLMNDHSEYIGHSKLDNHIKGKIFLIINFWTNSRNIFKFQVCYLDAQWILKINLKIKINKVNINKVSLNLVFLCIIPNFIQFRRDLF